MPLETLPVELIESIAAKVTSGAGLNALSRTNRHFHQILDRRLYACRSNDKALFFSINKGYSSVLEKAIRGGADLNSLYEWAPGARFTTPLAFAAGTGHVEIVKLLLKHGADPNPVRWEEIRHTPLSVAAGKRHYETAKILIDAGADVHTTFGEPCGSLALHAAVGYYDEDDDLVRLLLENGALDNSPQEYRGTAALEEALTYGRVSTVKLLLQAGANPVFRGSDDWTPVMLAIFGGSEELAFLFLEMGADLEQTCNKGRGLVWYAVWYSCPNVLRYVLERGCSANDHAALRIAFENEEQDIIELLLERGASLEEAGLDESKYRHLISSPRVDHQDAFL
ncbi:uncharacterized protein NECHADRAFT_82987 [Fusarium vanettenii 77-13-4]|uniref:F-box domain-containing protein n=1 Tax=Fusarium vanettenii (strain ATCC MYA-4622 / CBS 123669 / FGSC 9596 / NRRL 45880 / 77-13-4) TaxID=660122 RepID=C7ZAU6_FUSV7|nr:uncharacterized protein NECHADRAFT_82987 [Fusarium vanettenii 77-13-4]EEU38767.1 hypothetical protein NECHADRAFT_82987 [Fusarium vanettenii 77-13-4]